MHYDFDPALDAPATRKERWVWMVFLGILTVGFIYEWKKGALDWE